MVIKNKRGETSVLSMIIYGIVIFIVGIIILVAWRGNFFQSQGTLGQFGVGSDVSAAKSACLSACGQGQTAEESYCYAMRTVNADDKVYRGSCYSLESSGLGFDVCGSKINCQNQARIPKACSGFDGYSWNVPTNCASGSDKTSSAIDAGSNSGKRCCIAKEGVVFTCDDATKEVQLGLADNCPSDKPTVKWVDAQNKCCTA